MLDSVEYFAPGMLDGPTTTKTEQLYCGVVERKSDGITCLAVRAPEGERRHHIEVGAVHAISLYGQRHVLETPAVRYRIRAQEIIRLAEGEFSEEWARSYFDPHSPDFWNRETFSEATPPSEQTEPEPHTVPSALRLRATLLALLAGYLLGRWRIIRWVLRTLHQHWGLWL